MNLQLPRDKMKLLQFIGKGLCALTLHINWSEPLIEDGEVLLIKPTDLNDFYAKASDLDKSNLFFILLNSFHHYFDLGETEKAAHLSFLLAYYLFVPLTPPASCDLALHYIKQALSLNPLDEYRKWLSLMEKGN
ncbi:MAG: hypothetical protein E7475_05760 [Ruminococcaceae bacterium]|nr:hypothetical protein [Oscillospiraceae bacterium]